MFPLIDIHTHRPEPGTTCIRNIRLQGTVPAWPETDLFSAGIHPWDAAEAHVFAYFYFYSCCSCVNRVFNKLFYNRSRSFNNLSRGYLIY